MDREPGFKKNLDPDPDSIDQMTLSCKKYLCKNDFVFYTKCLPPGIVTGSK